MTSTTTAMASHLQPSPSFAQTGAELDLDDSDIDDLDLHAVAAGGNAAETYEMRTSNGTWETRRIGDDSYGGGSRALWDAEDEIPEDQDDDDDDDIEMHRFTPEGSSETGSSSVASFQLYTPDEEAAVRHKFDRKLVIFVALLYMLSFLDRSSTYTQPGAGDEDCC